VSESQAIELDREDILAHKRHEFKLDSEVIYLDGNSLGAMPLVCAQRAREVIESQWGIDLISSWNKHHWIDLPTQVGEKIAPLLGAAPGQVICCDSISVNLFKLLSCAISMRPDRRIILSQKDNFPADLYIGQGLSELLGTDKCELQLVSESEVQNSITDEVAVVVLTHVNYKSGKLHDIQNISRLAHEQGALVIWDLAHSTGALPLEMDKCNVDFAVGCGYKYLNGGPGSPAFIYAATRHQHAIKQPLSGWMGHSQPFAFANQYEPASGVQQFLSGTPGILSMSVLDAALEVYKGVDLIQLREKSLSLGELFLKLVNDKKELSSLKLVSPEACTERGSQLAFSHPQAFEISQALIDQGVIVDFRSPDILRFGFAPLYVRHLDVFKAVEVLVEVVSDQIYLQEIYGNRQKVT
jgi:kynureninase